MENESDTEPGRIVPANGNNDASDQPDAGTWQRADRAALTLARIIDRRVAREHFERLHYARHSSDNQRDASIEDRWRLSRRIEPAQSMKRLISRRS